MAEGTLSRLQPFSALALPCSPQRSMLHEFVYYSLRLHRPANSKCHPHRWWPCAWHLFALSCGKHCLKCSSGPPFLSCAALVDNRRVGRSESASMYAAIT